MISNFLKQSESTALMRVECPNGFIQFQDSCEPNIIPREHRVDRIKGWSRLAPRWVDQKKVIQFLETGDESVLPPAFFPEGKK